ncbi:MAG: methionine biosynthesis protein MetW [Candidatus Hinthialibacter antarcticus]|nr:methionine biosynthesis protein MetW [Candidatus Hinthialibacter antarcticus]
MTEEEKEYLEQIVRYEHEVISDLVNQGAKVLDLGCGEGQLLELLKRKNKAQGTGVEVAQGKVYKCISKGLTVFHGDIDEGLADFPDKSFDYVLLTDTLQEVRHPSLVIKEMLRVGKQCVVSFPNFGYWSVRVQLMLYGRSPITRALPFDWWETPNLHFFTVRDFFRFCDSEGFHISQSVFIRNGKRMNTAPNLFAEEAVCVLESSNGD